jgi:hypothetical protein
MRTMPSTEREVDGLGAEGRCGDEDALLGALAGEGAVEALDVGAAYTVLPALGLDVDLFEAEAVEMMPSMPLSPLLPTCWRSLRLVP